MLNTNFLEKFWDNVRARNETLPKNCGCIEPQTSKNRAVKENVIDVQRGECSWESLQKDPTQWESTGEHLGEEKVRVYRSTVARLN